MKYKCKNTGKIIEVETVKGLYPCNINSSLLTAQLRNRYYWSNIRTKETMFDIVTDIPQPKDKGIMFKDIITDGHVERVKALALLESESRVCTSQESIKKRAEREFINMIYVDTDKHTCLNTGSGATEKSSQRYLKHRNETTGMLTLIKENEIVRTVNKIEMCRLQGFPDNYCDILSTKKSGSLLGDGWTLPIIEHIFSFIKF